MNFCEKISKIAYKNGGDKLQTYEALAKRQGVAVATFKRRRDENRLTIKNIRDMGFDVLLDDGSKLIEFDCRMVFRDFRVGNKLPREEAYARIGMSYSYGWEALRQDKVSIIKMANLGVKILVDGYGEQVEVYG